MIMSQSYWSKILLLFEMFILAVIFRKIKFAFYQKLNSYIRADQRRKNKKKCCCFQLLFYLKAENADWDMRIMVCSSNRYTFRYNWIMNWINFMRGITISFDESSAITRKFNRRKKNGKNNKQKFFGLKAFYS